MAKQTVKCDKCDGTGEVPNQRVLAASLRVIREKAGVSLRALATAMKVSAPYLSDLELARRNWSPETVQAFHNALSRIRTK